MCDLCCSNPIGGIVVIGLWEKSCVIRLDVVRRDDGFFNWPTSTTVDGRNPANQLICSLCSLSHYLQSFIHSRIPGGAGFLNHQQYGMKQVFFYRCSIWSHADNAEVQTHIIWLILVTCCPGMVINQTKRIHSLDPGITWCFKGFIPWILE